TVHHRAAAAPSLRRCGRHAAARIPLPPPRQFQVPAQLLAHHLLDLVLLVDFAHAIAQVSRKFLRYCRSHSSLSASLRAVT
ncbi:hypothetical protein, partial [Bordetella bronchiseptica]|uniref:hypothetical protein n=1 Tax=Bordetella bronchiseptica TaxID=518 RepID=UPI0020B15A23